MRFLAAAAVLCISIGPLRADDQTAAAREHYRKATNAFELGNFSEAIREYSEAYRLRDDPAILYNLGQAHRLGQHPAEALHFYKMFLTKVPEASNRAEVEAKIDALQKLVDEQRRTQNMPPVSTLSPAPSMAPAKPARSPRAPLPPGRVAKISGIVVGGVGLGLVATGIAFGALAKNAGEDLTRLASMGMFDYGEQQTGKRDQALEGAFLGVGCAALATGAALYALGHLQARHAESRRPLAVAPLVGTGFGGAAVQMRF